MVLNFKTSPSNLDNMVKVSLLYTSDVTCYFVPTEIHSLKCSFWVNKDLLLAAFWHHTFQSKQSHMKTTGKCHKSQWELELLAFISTHSKECGRITRCCTFVTFLPAIAIITGHNRVTAVSPFTDLKVVASCQIFISFSDTNGSDWNAKFWTMFY